MIECNVNVLDSKAGMIISTPSLTFAVFVIFHNSM